METKLFPVDDLLIASYLLAKGATFVRIQADYSNHCTFLFENPRQCEQLKKDYVNNGLASARELFARREELLSEIKNQRTLGGL